MHKIKGLIGDKAFYRRLVLLVLPMILQQGISSAVNLLDNVMVGSLGTAAISGVAIVNQFFFVFHLTIFGGLAGASIFSSQYHGRGDVDGVRYAFRYKILFGLVVSTFAFFLFKVFGSNIIGLYLNKETTSAADLAATMAMAQQYLKYLVWGTFPFIITQCFSGTLRETGNTFYPMVSGIISMLVNLVFNYILIFGKFGFPQMGVAGAALATLLARLVETSFISLMTYYNRVDNPFIIGAFKSLKIPMDIFKNILFRGLPLLANEFIWSFSTSAVAQSYAYRGVEVLAAMNISQTISQLFNVFFFAMGNSVAIIVGQELGAGNIEGAKDLDKKIIAFNVTVTMMVGLALALAAPYVPHIYNTELEVRNLATSFLFVQAFMLPIYAFNHSTYFTLRAGGQTYITFLFDSVFAALISFPLAYFISRHTALGIITMYMIVSGADFIKGTIGFTFLRKGNWAKTIVL